MHTILQSIKSNKPNTKRKHPKKRSRSIERFLILQAMKAIHRSSNLPQSKLNIRRIVRMQDSSEISDIRLNTKNE